jgi:hypothetical protein
MTASVPPKPLSDLAWLMLRRWEGRAAKGLHLFSDLALPFANETNRSPLEPINELIAHGLVTKEGSVLALSVAGAEALALAAWTGSERPPARPPVIELIRAARSGILKVGIPGGGALTDNGVETVRAGGWLLRFFVDAGCLDYLDAVVDPFGTEHGHGEVGGILAALDPGELDAVGRWLESVEPWC